MNLLLTSLRAGMLTPGRRKHITAINQGVNTAAPWPASPASAGRAAPAAAPGQGLRQRAARTAARAGAWDRPRHRPTRAAPALLGALVRAEPLPVALSKGSPRLEPCARCLGTGGLLPARWGREHHFSACIYGHISSRISSKLQHKLKTKQKNPANSVTVISPELTLPGSRN